MASILAHVRLDPDRTPEQSAFLRSRVTVLREAGGQCWVRMDAAQVDTLISQGLQVESDPDFGWLHLGPLAWRPADETPQPPAALRAAEPTGAAEADWLLQFIAPPDKSWLQDLELAGAQALQQLDAGCAVYRMTAAVATAVRALPQVASLGLFHPAYVPSLELAGLQAPLDAAGLAALQLTLPEAEAGQPNLQLRVFDGIDAADVRAALQAAGATVLGEITQGFDLRVPAAALAAVLSVPGLLAASTPVLTSPDNHNAGVIVGANQVRDLGTVNFLVNLDGLGEIGAVVDTGFDVGNLAGATPPSTGVVTPFHPELAANMRLLAHSATPLVAAPVPDNSPHGTHVAGIVAGDGSQSAGLTRGAAPRAALVGLAPIPGNVRTPFDFAAANGARVINNSWGSFFPVGLNNNRYTATQGLAIDRWCVDNPEVLLVFTAGNAESDTQGGGDGVLDAVMLRLQAAAKNVLAVGASESLRIDGGWRDSYRAFFGPRYNHPAFNVTAGGAGGSFGFSDNANQVGLFSGRGAVRTAALVNTGRVKPDLVAPGTNILSTRSQWVAQPPALPVPLPAPPPALPLNIPDPFYGANSDSMLPAGFNRNLHQILTGTSMAAPLVSGAALLVRQYIRTRHAQMRRPLLLESVAMPAAPPLPGFASRPSIARHLDGLVCAWVTPALPGGTQRIMAQRIGRQQAPVDAVPVRLQDDVGEHAALKIVTQGERSYLLHRHRDGKMRLSAYDRRLAPVPGFGAGGVVTLAPDARSDDAAPPALIVVNDQLVCVWPTTGGNGGFIQRFDAASGAALDVASISLLFFDSTGPQHPLVWNGSRIALCGVLHGADFKLQVRQIDVAGQPQGAGPVTVLAQAAEVRDPALLYDPRSTRHLLVWCDARTLPGGEVWMQFLDAQATALGTPQLVMSVPAAHRMRRPQVSNHPDGGYLLAWEDDSQGGHFDAYATLLDGLGQVDGRMALDAAAAGRRALRLSDTPLDVDGYAFTGDGAGFVFVFQSPDEVNTDRVGVQMLNLTRGLAFEAQEDPSTPLQRSGQYVTVMLTDHAATALTPLSAVWTGATWDLLRVVPGEGVNNQQQWLRLNADGLADARHGVGGVRELPYTGQVFGVDVLWTGNDRRISAVNDSVAGISLHLADADGVPVPGFGAAGAAALQDSVPLHERTTPQLGFFTQPAFTILVAYGSLQAGVLHLRQQRINAAGRRAGNAVDLLVCEGVAAHQWFMFVNGEARSIAIFHRSSGADMQVRCRQFSAVGAPLAVEQRLSSATGLARNGVLARRPTASNSAQREYAAVWQYRANAAARSELRFSRLNRQGVPLANPPVAGVVQPTADIAVVDAATPGWNTLLDAVEPQLVCTYTHQPWAIPPPLAVTPPIWSPSFGLAWIGVAADGSRSLHFTLLDENGRRAALPQPPPAAAGAALLPLLPAPILRLGGTAARVQDFRLVWNGRVFMLAWTEEEAGRLRQCVSFVNRHAGQQAHALPSAALLRATLVGGATNITPGPLPNLAAGYGWGRLNLRQSLAPALPATLQLRDDCAIGPGRSVRYRFALPTGTALLRVTLNWTDPPGPRLVNHLHLTVHAPAAIGLGAGTEYRGNLWDTAAGRTHLSRAVPVVPTPADNHEDVQTFKQVVIANPPAGDYEVEVSATAFPADPFNQQNLQAFALVFAGSGPEVVFNLPQPAVAGAPVY